MDQPTGTGHIRRFSSRRQRLGHSFFNERLKGALTYDRIAGYFSGSLLEVAGEALESVTGIIRIVCNSELRPQDVETARAAASAIRKEWCDSNPESLVDLGDTPSRARFSRLYEFLKSGKLQVKVLPNEYFGLIHGKAGVITLPDGTRTTFLGSVNESHAAWNLNYELLWEDNSPEAAEWVQEEFDALWQHYAAVDLADFVIEDVGRISRRQVTDSVNILQPTGENHYLIPNPAPAFVESPVYRRQAGLWEHQKYFVKVAFEAHSNNPGGARFVLADQVGLGKTIQLAMAAELMALVGEKPILILTPKSLVWQWQDELLELLAIPSAVWDKDQWVDEREIRYPGIGPKGILKCPRRIGIVPTSRAIFQCEDASFLKTIDFECVVVDEAHNARRKNLSLDHLDSEKADPNNLLRFLFDLSTRTKSMLLATATPVQLRPIEAWDLLDILAQGSDAVLGSRWGKWRQNPGEALKLVSGEKTDFGNEIEAWEWIRTPFPPATEHRDFAIIRKSLDMDNQVVSASGSDWNKLTPADQARIRAMSDRFVEQHNPFIRHIIRRSRKYLETTINPETREPYLKPIKVELFGERDDEAIRLPAFLQEAYKIAGDFCRLLGSRVKGAGFLKTLLLRRLGSSIAAGKNTAKKMLESWTDVESTGLEWNPETEDTEAEAESRTSESKTLTVEERQLLSQFLDALERNVEHDPKYAIVMECLRDRDWLRKGCIIFSQYYDSIKWLVGELIKDFPNEPIAIYAGSGKSGIWKDNVFRSVDREKIKAAVRNGEIRILLGTDAASEGLNLQRLGTLINLDLPWNPTRLEQRKGRIQRIGQLNDVVYLYNMRYLGSVEDRVHHLLSSRLQHIFQLFGQVPDMLEDVWIEVALGQESQAKKLIDTIPNKHPFDIKYHNIEAIDWESCDHVLSEEVKRTKLFESW